MGAIGGIVDFKGGDVDFTTINTMRSALSLRGREKSSAYFDNGLGVFYNYDGIFDNNGVEQPVISERRGKVSVLLLDSDGLSGKGVMEKYRVNGVEFLSKLSEPFAIAVYDATRRMLLLARDKKGKKPLFYSLKSGRVSFSSEAKGLLSMITEEINIDRDVLSYHLTSASGVYRASDIYSDIFEISAGECILFTEMGISRFFYREDGGIKKNKNIPLYVQDYEKIVEPYIDINEEIISNSLSDSLVAFDIPQFDMLIPSIHETFFRVSKNQERVFKFNDRSKCSSLSYSYERADRFSSFFGVSGSSVASKSDPAYNERCEIEAVKLYSYLRESFFNINNEGISFLRRIFGSYKMDYIMRTFSNEKIKKEDTEIGIRILGMLCQTVEWNTLRKLNIKSFEQRMYSFSE